MPTSVLRFATLTGPLVEIQDRELQLLSQVVQLRLPAFNGGLIWNRPVGMLVRTPNGQEQIVSIPDMTRTAMLILAGLCFASMFLIMFFKRKIAES